MAIINIIGGDVKGGDRIIDIERGCTGNGHKGTRDHFTPFICSLYY
jgi:hypothetical protein